MNVLVTGGAGYVGVMLTEALLKKGHFVTIFDNFMYGYDSVLYLIRNDNLRVIKGDIRNDDRSYVDKQDVIYHLAAISGYPACEANPHSAEVINVDATKKIVDYLRNDQILIYASTTSFYGKSGERCDEDSPISPVSLYGITKYEAEKIVMQRSNSVSLRFATIFGVSPRMRIDLLVNDFVYRAITERSLIIFDGYSKRTFLHIKDAVDAYTFTLDNFDRMKGRVFNAGSEKLNYSKFDIANKIREFVDFEIVTSTLADFDVRDFLVSFKRINELGYTPSLTLEYGIKELVKLYSFYRPFSTFKTI